MPTTSKTPGDLKLVTDLNVFLYALFLLSRVYSWIDYGLQSGPTLAFLLWMSDFKTKTSFGFLIKKSVAIFLKISEKSKNELVRPKTMFLAILAKFLSFSNNSHM